jgi:tetratricopeptide (TPR) repeat protein
LEWVDKAITLTDRLDAGSIRQRALQFRGIARFDLGDLGGVEDLREAVRLGQQLGLGRETALAYQNYGFHLFWLEGPAAALPSFHAALALSEQRGITETALAAQDAILSALIDLGDWQEALDLADRLITVWLASGAPSLAAFAEERKAHILLCRGEVPEATRLMERVLLHAGEMGDPQVLLNVLPTAARVEQARGDHDAAVRLVEELHQATREGPDVFRTEPLPTLVRVCAAAGRLSLIERLLDGVEARVPRHQHSLVTARAVFAEAREDFETASALYADAAERWAGHRVALEHGQALLGQGRCLTRLASPLGRGRLLEARTVLARLEARPLLDEINDWLKQAITHGQ